MAAVNGVIVFSTLHDFNQACKVAQAQAFELMPPGVNVPETAIAIAKWFGAQRRKAAETHIYELQLYTYQLPDATKKREQLTLAALKIVVANFSQYDKCALAYPDEKHFHPNPNYLNYTANWFSYTTDRNACYMRLPHWVGRGIIEAHALRCVNVELASNTFPIRPICSHAYAECGCFPHGIPLPNK